MAAVAGKALATCPSRRRRLSALCWAGAEAPAISASLDTAQPHCYHPPTMTTPVRVAPIRQHCQQAMTLVLLAPAWPVALPAG